MQRGAQPFFFEWSKNGRLIKPGPGVKWEIETSRQFSSLNIQKILNEDAGNYSCLVKNIYGSDSINVMLTVKGMIILIYLNLVIVMYSNVWRYRSRKYAEPH